MVWCSYVICLLLGLAYTPLATMLSYTKVWPWNQQHVLGIDNGNAPISWDIVHCRAHNNIHAATISDNSNRTCSIQYFVINHTEALSDLIRLMITIPWLMYHTHPPTQHNVRFILVQCHFFVKRQPVTQQSCVQSYSWQSFNQIYLTMFIGTI
jgi:hypothetical protein